MRDKKSTFSVNLIYQSLFCLIAGSVAGWLLTEKLAGVAAATSFVKISIPVILLDTIAVVVLFVMSRERLLHQLNYGIAFSMSLVWFMLCLLLPVFWIKNIDHQYKISIAALTLVLCISNALKGFAAFKTGWDKYGPTAFAKYYHAKRSEVEWPKIVKLINFTPSLYIPGVPERWVGLLSIPLVFFMILGLSLRNAFPTFSIFAWGIPAGATVSLIVQMIGFGMAQVAQIVELENEQGNRIRPKP